MAKAGCFSSFLCFTLKFFNFIIAFVGVDLVLSSLWFLYSLPASHESIATADSWFTLPNAWFSFFLLALGVILCMTALVGHLAAETGNGCLLSCYTLLLLLLMFSQGAFVTNIVVNKNWEESIPNDPSGLYDYIKKFVETNMDVCKWGGFAIVIVEAIAAVLALWIKTIAPRSCCGSYESDDEYLEPGECMLSKSATQKSLLKHSKNGAKTTSRVVQGVPYRAIPANGRVKVVYDTSWA